MLLFSAIYKSVWLLVIIQLSTQEWVGVCFQWGLTNKQNINDNLKGDILTANKKFF